MLDLINGEYRGSIKNYISSASDAAHGKPRRAGSPNMCPRSSVKPTIYRLLVIDTSPHIWCTVRSKLKGGLQACSRLLRDTRVWMEFMQHQAFKFSLPLTMFAQCFQPNTCHIMQHHAQKLGFARRRLLACWKRTLNLNLSHVKWNPCFCTISHIKRRFLVTCLASETRTKKTNTRPVRESDLSMHGLAWREISCGLFSHHHHCGILHRSTFCHGAFGVCWHSGGHDYVRLGDNTTTAPGL